MVKISEEKKLTNYEKAEKDYNFGMSYKDIAKKYGVAVGTVKSWKTRYKWEKQNRLKKVCKVASMQELGNILESIKSDMLNKLKSSGNDTRDNIEWVNTYIALAETKYELFKDIKTRGVNVEWSNGKQKSRKKNDSVSEIPKIIKSMLDIRKSLGLELLPNGDGMDYEDL